MFERVIYKYAFEEEMIRAGIDYIDIPPGKVVLVAQKNNERLPSVWVEHTLPVPEIVKDRYRIAGTGVAIGAQFTNWKHVGSCICGTLVWHVYRKENFRGQE